MLVGILSLGAQSAFGAPAGGFDKVQTAAFFKGTTEHGTFVVELQRTVEHGGGVAWAIGLEFDDDDEFDAFEFDDEVPPQRFNVDFNTGWATVETKVDGCKLDVPWEGSGEEFRSDNFHDDGEGVEVRGNGIKGGAPSGAPPSASANSRNGNGDSKGSSAEALKLALDRGRSRIRALS